MTDALPLTILVVGFALTLLVPGRPAKPSPGTRGRAAGLELPHHAHRP